MLCKMNDSEAVRYELYCGMEEAFMQEKETELEVFLDGLLEFVFFKECVASEEKNRRQEGRWMLLKGELLLQQYYGEDESAGFTEEVPEYFLEKLNRCFTDKQKNILISAIEYLSDAFGKTGAKVKKEEVPFLIYQAELAQEQGIFPDDFAEVWCAGWEQ